MLARDPIARLKWRQHAVITILGILCCGCVRHSYEIEMSLENEGTVQRRISGWKGKPETKVPFPLPQDEQARLSAAYGGVEVINVANKSVVEGTFDGRLPSELGGFGRMVHWSTSLGDLWAYTERFRGQDEPLRLLEARMAAIDRLTELLAEWAESEIADEESRHRISRFLTTDFRRDLHNLSLYASMAPAKAVASEDGNSSLGVTEILLRIELYLHERNYLTTDMLPRFVRVWNSPAPNEDALKLLVSSLNHRLNLPADSFIEQLIPAFRSPAALEDSLNTFLRSTPEYEAKIAHQRNQSVPDSHQSQPIAILGDLLFEGFGIRLANHDHLVVRFRLPEQPFATNGLWNEDGTVEWSDTLEIPGEGPLRPAATFCFAVWSRPKEDFQKDRFGRTLLIGKALGEYVVWRRSLTAAEGHEWDAFLTTLTAGQNPALQLEAYHQKAETNAEPAISRDLTNIPRNLFQQAWDER